MNVWFETKICYAPRGVLIEGVRAFADHMLENGWCAFHVDECSIHMKRAILCDGKKVVESERKENVDRICLAWEEWQNIPMSPCQALLPKVEGRPSALEIGE